MTIRSKEQEAAKVSIIVDRDPVSTSFEKWAQPGHFSRTLAKGPKTTGSQTNFETDNTNWVGSKTFNFKTDFYFEDEWLKESFVIDNIKDICYFLMNNN